MERRADPPATHPPGERRRPLLIGAGSANLPFGERRKRLINLLLLLPSARRGRGKRGLGGISQAGKRAWPWPRRPPPPPPLPSPPPPSPPPTSLYPRRRSAAVCTLPSPPLPSPTFAVHLPPFIRVNGGNPSNPHFAAAHPQEQLERRAMERHRRLLLRRAAAPRISYVAGSAVPAPRPVASGRRVRPGETPPAPLVAPSQPPSTPWLSYFVSLPLAPTPPPPSSDSPSSAAPCL